jgi:hypothetical protein
LLILEKWIIFIYHNIHHNTVSIKSAHAMWKVLMVQSCDKDILEGLAVADPAPQNPKSIVS